MKIVLNHEEILAMLQNYVAQVVVPNLQVKDFDVKGLRTQEGYQLEINTDLAINLEQNQQVCSDELFNHLYDLKQVHSQLRDSLQDILTEATSELHTEEQEQTDMNVPVVPVISVESETKPNKDTFKPEPEPVEEEEEVTKSPEITDLPDEDVDIFGNPIPQAKTFAEMEEEQKQQNKTDSLFSN